MKYKIGDKFWRVNKVFNGLTGSRNKLTMLDADGNEWYRYDKDEVDFDIREVEIVGTFNAVIEGHSIWYEEEYLDKYAVRIDQHYEECCEDELDGEHEGHYVSYWKTKEEAEEYIKVQREYFKGT